MAPVRPNPTLSEDLISEILVRVPVKSLLCFQSVSKTWLSLIKDPAFVRSQLRHAITNQIHHTLIKHETFSLLDVFSRQIVAHLKFPCPPGEVNSVSIVGSANGIVCVAVEFHPNFRKFDDTGFRKTDIYLWNPAIRQSKLIPSLFDTSDNIMDGNALGFGYDVVDHDFKVASFVVLCPPRPCYGVYSDNRNAWREVSVPEPMDYPHTGAFDVCINGFLCGIGGNYGMMAFDLNHEVLNCGIKLPVIDDAHAQNLLNCAIKLHVMSDAHVHVEGDDDYDYGYEEYNATRIIKVNNSVAVIMLMDSNKKINMWTLDDDACLRGGGVEASWTPMFSIDLGISASLVHGYFSNGNLLLVLLIGDVKMLILCNADKKEAKIAPLSVDMAHGCYDRVIYKYTESLVSLAGFRHVDSRMLVEMIGKRLSFWYLCAGL